LEKILKTIILGIGNTLISDDGVGVHIINKLENEYHLPDGVSIIDGGTKGLDLLPFIEGSDRLLIVDAANFDKEPGTIDTVVGDDIPQFLSMKLSMHQIGLPDMLFAAKLMDIAPSEMCLVGIQPKSMETGTELSDEIKSRFDALFDKVMEKLKEWDITPTAVKS
jgi:hydrogenase maturation protease